jgi:hypothetical protein
MTETGFTYQEHSRRPATILALVLSFAFLGFAIYASAPWYTYVPVLIGAAMSAWMVTFDRVSGCQLNDKELTLYVQDQRQTFPIDTISSVTITNWGDSAPSVRLNLVDRKPVDVASYCVGSVSDLTAALEARAVPVKVDA